jgi:hypothetical protein
VAYNVYSLPDCKSVLYHPDVGTANLHQCGIGKIVVLASALVLVLALVLESAWHYTKQTREQNTEFTITPSDRFIFSSPLLKYICR